MATNKHAIIRYEALDRCFSNKGRKFFIDDLILYITQAIKDYSGSETSISRRQIFNDIDFMRSEAGFRAPIESYKEGRKTYYRYSDSSYSLAIQQINPVEADLLKTALDMLGRFKGLPKFDFIQELSLKLKKSFQLEELGDYILFDQNEYLKNLDLLGSLLNHIQNKQTLQLSYKSFNQEKEKSFIIHPYFLKQYNKRWFLFGQCEGYDNWTNLPLDRITKFIELENIKYIEPTESPTNYFEDLIGVSKPNDVQPQLIQIKIIKALWPYIDSKPLHPSQKVINKTAEHTTIQLELIPNYEFYSHILGFGPSLEILSPVDVRNAIGQKLKDSYGLYFN
nr:WYL domain-containing protein [uncultured Sphingobacterium sp.]